MAKKTQVARPAKTAKPAENCTVVAESKRHPRHYLLLVETARHKKHMLNTPGGSVEKQDRGKGAGKPAFFVCGVRELLEETGLRLDPEESRLVAENEDPGQPNSRHRVIGGRVIDETVRTSKEHPYMGFFSVGQIEGFEEFGLLRSPRVLQAIKNYDNGMGVDLGGYLAICSDTPKEYPADLVRPSLEEIADLDA
jgi:8-oxo-dGTP pyrophosphatase MutT (NUDIX family)